MGGTIRVDHDGAVFTTALPVDRTLSIANAVGADTGRGGWERNLGGREDRTQKVDSVKEVRVKGMSRRKCRQCHKPQRGGCEIEIGRGLVSDINFSLKRHESPTLNPVTLLNSLIHSDSWNVGLLLLLFFNFYVHNHVICE